MNILDTLSVGCLKDSYKQLLKDYLGHLETVKRLDRAYEMLTRDERYSFTYCKSTSNFYISGPNDTYTVSNVRRECTCPDKEILCKHRIAVRLIEATVKRMLVSGLSIERRD